MYDLIVVGGGPAGLTATVYAIRKRIKVLLLTKDLGGATSFRLGLPWIDDYQLIRGWEIVDKFRSELEYLDFARHMEPVNKIEPRGEAFVVLTKGGGELETRAIIIASGTRQVRLDVPGEKEYFMKGVCYSALSYAPLFIDKTTMVIGDGDLALRSAAELATVSKHVYLVRAGCANTSSPLCQKLSTAANVTILQGYQVVEIKGDEYARSVMVKSPDDKLSEIAVDGTFVEMALIPNSKMVEGLVKLDTQGRIMVDCANRTSVPGIFAAGDVTNTYAEQVLVAVGEGAKAVLSAYDYLLPML
jgi:alkyl hydroperoxide reductase subunit F